MFSPALITACATRHGVARIVPPAQHHQPFVIATLSTRVMTETLEVLERRSLEEDDSPVVPPPDIVAYNELRSCADLFRMHQQGILDIQPEFQREVVWSGPDQTRFVDSLIKQLPIPSMCFALDYKAQRWIVIDGLQRISTIVRFLRGEDWKLSRLDDIEPDIAGVSAAAIRTAAGALHQYYTRVENLSVPITVLRCDFKKSAHTDYLFTIFHRLNTGGMKLNNQEIRNCIFSGSFNNLLKELDTVPAWRRLNKMRANQAYRYTKQELILRFFAFGERRSKYEGHLAKFLNEYMHRNQHADAAFIEQKRELFLDTVEFITAAIFDGDTVPKLSLTVLEALLVGVGANTPTILSSAPGSARSKYEELLADPAFTEAALREGLSKRLRVIERLNRAAAIFAS
jgi:hypothetical protein